MKPFTFQAPPNILFEAGAKIMWRVAYGTLGIGFGSFAIWLFFYGVGWALSGFARD